MLVLFLSRRVVKPDHSLSVAVIKSNAGPQNNIQLLAVGCEDRQAYPVHSAAVV